MQDRAAESQNPPMTFSAECWVENGQICLRVPYEAVSAVHRIGGGRWNPVAKVWTWPATPGFWARVTAEFPQPSALTGGGHDLEAAVACRRLAYLGATSGFRSYQTKTAPWAHQVPATTFAILTDAALLDCHMGTGKAVSVNATVWTPAGPKRMGDIQVGDAVLTATGGTTTVVGVFPQGQQDLYRLTFSPDDTVECTQDHLWLMGHWRPGPRPIQQAEVQWQVRETRTLLRDYLCPLKRGDSLRRYFLPMPEPVVFQSRSVPIPPYTFGILIGDGHFGTTVTLTSADAEVVERVSSEIAPQWHLVQYAPITFGFTRLTKTATQPFNSLIGELGLTGKRAWEKQIPATYKYNDILVRREVLRGLMDADGTVSKSGNISITTTSPALASDIKEVVESLGGLCRVRGRYTQYTHKGQKTAGRKSYRCTIRMADPRSLFWLPRKRIRCQPREKYFPKRVLKKIEHAGTAECQCIAVGDPAGLYLMDHFIPTHNTKITIDALSQTAAKRVLVLCPCSAIEVWQREVQKHAPVPMHVVALTGRVADRARLVQRFLDNDPLDTNPCILFTTNYEGVRAEPLAKTVLGVVWDAVVFDEIHRLKAPGGKISRFCARIRAKKRLGLTGTVMPHSPLDVYGQYRALDPGIFGNSFLRFRDQYAVMGGWRGPDGRPKQVVSYKNEEDLRARMDAIRWRVTDAALDLPPLQVLDRFCSLEPDAMRKYARMERDFEVELKSGVVTASNALVKLLRLQEMTSGYLRPDGESLDRPHPERVSSAKITLFADLMEDIGDEDPVVVFCRFREDLDACRLVLGERRGPTQVGEISGRQKDYGTWQDGHLTALVVQIQSGGLGIDLSRARYGFFYSLGFSLGEYDQAVARLHRPGQAGTTIIYRLLAKSTVDQKIVGALDARRDVVRHILEEVGHA